MPGISLQEIPNERAQHLLKVLVDPSVDEKKVLNHVVGNKEIHEPVVVDIRRYDSQGFSQNTGDRGTLAHLGEAAVTVVAKKQARSGAKDAGRAVMGVARRVEAARDGVVQPVLHVAADE